MAEAAREAVAKVRIEAFCIAAEDHGCRGWGCQRSRSQGKNWRFLYSCRGPWLHRLRLPEKPYGQGKNWSFLYSCRGPWLQRLRLQQKPYSQGKNWGFLYSCRGPWLQRLRFQEKPYSQGKNWVFLYSIAMEGLVCRGWGYTRAEAKVRYEV
jgi:hypothetical protein